MTSESLDRIRREARVAGIRRVVTPSLDQVEGRRLQLWGLTIVVLVAMSAAVVASAGRALAPLTIPPQTLRAGVIALALAFCAYTIEKEVHLRRLTDLLVEEQLRGVALRAEIDRLLDADRVRSELVSSVTHDLKTPLTAILGSAELLEGGVPPAEAAVLTGVIQRQGANLERMVDALLAASVLEREGPVLELERVDLAPLVGEICADLVPAGIRASVELPVDSLAPVRASEDGLRRVVTNLVRNAATYGRPPVRVSLRPGDGDAWVLSVFDAGPGILEADRRRVFELFSRLDPARSGPGMGLGLAIVAGLVGAWGGRAWVDDAPEGGAAFHVALPRDPSAS